MTIFIAFISISYSASDIIASFFNFLQNALINPSSSRISLTMFSKDVIFPIKGLHREFPPHHFQDPKGNSSTFNTNLLPKNKKKYRKIGKEKVYKTQNLSWFNKLYSYICKQYQKKISIITITLAERTNIN